MNSLGHLDVVTIFSAASLLLLLGFFAGLFVSNITQMLEKILDYMKKSSKDKATIMIYPNKPDHVPRHIAVIMDGNRRFGRQKHKDPLQGHWAGGQTLIDFAQWCAGDGVEMLTVYAFSSENWNRDPFEINTLMSIFSKYAESFKTEALARNVRVKVLSTEFERLPLQVQCAVDELQRSTSNCTGFVLNICLSYGGRAEIVNACSALLKDRLMARVDESSTTSKEVTEAILASYLTTRDLPDPDILIRTSGEFRLSNFLLWQLAYSELFFIDKLWPEVTQDDLRRVMFEFSERNRRYGK